MKKKEPRNPFYLLLVIAGVLFVVTSCAYGVVAVRELAPRGAVRAPADGDEAESGRNMLAFMNHYGLSLLGGELAVLAVATVGAIGLDSVRQNRTPTDKP